MRIGELQFPCSLEVLATRLAACQCFSVGSCENWASVDTANAMSAALHVAAYMSDQ